MFVVTRCQACRLVCVCFPGYFPQWIFPSVSMSGGDEFHPTGRFGLKELVDVQERLHSPDNATSAKACKCLIEERYRELT